MRASKLSLTSMMIQHSTNADDAGEVTQQEDSNDDNYYLSTDLFDKSDKKENTFKEISSLDLPQSTKLTAFWSCILTILKVCFSCYQPAKIS